jgi:beta-lactamase regulating signal transducer with metallopeptidase domain
LRRGDHFVKLLAFLGLALHWFNPLMWLSYFLMTKDMELSCDESVMRRAKNDIRVGYSGSLLSMCVRQSGLPNPLQFGGSGVKSRIKNVLGFKKCSRFVTALSAVFAVMIVGVCVFNAASVDYAIQLNETEQVVWEIVEEIGEMSFVDSPVKTFYVTMSSHQSGFITTFTISARQR